MAAQSSPARIYLNFSGHNPSGEYQTPAEKTVRLNFPLLNNINPNEYDVAVARFSVPTGAIISPLSALGIIVETHSLPIVGEWDAESNMPFLVDVLSDTLALDPVSNPSQTLIYEPSFYRKSSFIGQGVLSSFDCKFSVRYKDGSILPLMIPPGEGWTLKIVLTRANILY